MPTIIRPDKESSQELDGTDKDVASTSFGSMLTFVLRHVGALITKQPARLKPSYMRETGGEERVSAVGYGVASRGR